MNWWHRLLRRGQMEEQLNKELRFHLEQHTADLIALGHDPGEALRQARLALGGPEQVKEQCRDARGTRWLDDLWQDFRYALRTLRQKPGFAAVALLTLALGIGATTVMFTVINGVLLKPLSYAQPDRLVLLQEQTDWSTQWGDLWAFTYPNYLDCRRESSSLDIAAWRFTGGTVTEPGEADYVNGRQVSSELLPLLGVSLARGRGFRPEDDRLGAPPVVIISYGLWQRRFAGSPEAIGRPLVFDGKPYTVAGVLPAGFRLGGDDADVFTPLGQDTSPNMQNREAHRIRVWARLKPGATLSAAQAELALVGRRLAEQYPKSNKGRTFIAQPLRPDVGDVGSTLWLLLGAVSLVLLIACANVASLLLARAVSRERELAMRVALGAGRSRLVRQCLTESALLGLTGGVLGVLLAAIGVRPFVTFWPGSLPRAEEVWLDWRVLLFALGASLASGLLFGLAPALRAPVRNLEPILRAGARTVAGSSRRLHSGFVISEIALAVVLLVAAGMLGRTMLRLSLLDPGVNLRNVLTARTALSPATLANTGRIRTAWDDILDRMRRVPGVEAVAMVDTVPMREGNNPIGYATTPAAPPAGKQPLVLANSVTPEYLKVMGLRLLEGRFFDDQDRMGSQSVVVIDEVMARQAFGGQEPVGKHLWIDLGMDPVTVVGVVGHVRYWGLAGDDQARVRAQLYYPFAQVPDKYLRRWSELMSVAVRTGIEPENMIEPLRHAVRAVTNDQVLYEVNTLEKLAGDSLARQRFLLLLFGIFAGLALLLASIGIYGVLAYLTSRRVPEFGVRMALGASARDVVWLVLRQSLGMIFLGVGVGISAALAAGRVLRRLVEGMQATGPSTFAIMIPVLVVAALFASFLPARRASRVEPMNALRQE
ncbi:MAG TPA: ABC transporter permease [Bryobacteraceae bacterium]|nr:ABC transporter permease [Bryobacteraceae bacterium]